MDLMYYLKKPWVLGEYECWAMVCDYYKAELGVDLPLINIGTTDLFVKRRTFMKNSAYRFFDKFDSPKNNDVVAMCNRDDKKRRFIHVGVYVEADFGVRVMHSTKSAGTLIQKPEELDCGIICYYRLKQD